MNSSLFRVNEDSSMFLLGYTIRLTPMEHKVICLLYQNQDGISTQQMASLLFSDKDISKRNIAVHICNINKKAKRISGRVLIKGNRRYGYKISDNI